MEITFHGAAGEVTGSCARVRHEQGVFLVDCGLFQGGRDAVRKNWHALDFDLGEVDCVVLTHAHLDHAGLMPRLVALGYRGRIFATPATADLLGIVLLDAAHIQEKEMEWASRRVRSRHGGRALPSAPLYTVEKARASLTRLRGVGYDDTFSPARGVSCRFRDAGHILGSAILEVDVGVAGRQRRLVFSGDLGQPMRPVLRDPAWVRAADYLCVESTYGNRAHRPLQQTENELVEVLRNTLEIKRGNVIIPAFAVGRTQEIVFVLADLVRQGRVGPLEVVIDSPMALAVTELTLKHDDLWDDETHALLAWARAHPDRIKLRFVQDVAESMALNSRPHGLVIISASGMCEAGRIRHHLRHNIARRECSIVICGFQAAGTLGRRLVDGVRMVTLFGERMPVRADIHTIGGLSAHADQPALLAWLRHFEGPPRRTFVVHGEPLAAEAFVDAVGTHLNWPHVDIPVAGRTYPLA